MPSPMRTLITASGPPATPPTGCPGPSRGKLHSFFPGGLPNWTLLQGWVPGTEGGSVDMSHRTGCIPVLLQRLLALSGLSFPTREGGGASCSRFPVFPVGPHCSQGRALGPKFKFPPSPLPWSSRSCPQLPVVLAFLRSLPACPSAYSVLRPPSPPGGLPSPAGLGPQNRISLIL